MSREIIYLQPKARQSEGYRIVDAEGNYIKDIDTVSVSHWQNPRANDYRPNIEIRYVSRTADEQASYERRQEKISEAEMAVKRGEAPAKSSSMTWTDYIAKYGSAAKVPEYVQRQYPQEIEAALRKEQQRQPSQPTPTTRQEFIENIRAKQQYLARIEATEQKQYEAIGSKPYGQLSEREIELVRQREPVYQTKALPPLRGDTESAYKRYGELSADERSRFIPLPAETTIPHVPHDTTSRYKMAQAEIKKMYRESIAPKVESIRQKVNRNNPSVSMDLNAKTFTKISRRNDFSLTKMWGNIDRPLPTEIDWRTGQIKKRASLGELTVPSLQKNIIDPSDKLWASKEWYKKPIGAIGGRYGLGGVTKLALEHPYSTIGLMAFTPAKVGKALFYGGTAATVAFAPREERLQAAAGGLSTIGAFKVIKWGYGKTKTGQANKFLNELAKEEPINLEIEMRSGIRINPKQVTVEGTSKAKIGDDVLTGKYPASKYVNFLETEAPSTSTLTTRRTYAKNRLLSILLGYKGIEASPGKITSVSYGGKTYTSASRTTFNPLGKGNQFSLTQTTDRSGYSTAKIFKDGKLLKTIKGAPGKSGILFSEPLPIGKRTAEIIQMDELSKERMVKQDFIKASGLYNGFRAKGGGVSIRTSNLMTRTSRKGYNAEDAFFSKGVKLNDKGQPIFDLYSERPLEMELPTAFKVNYLEPNAYRKKHGYGSLGIFDPETGEISLITKFRGRPIDKDAMSKTLVHEMMHGIIMQQPTRFKTPYRIAKSKKLVNKLIPTKYIKENWGKDYPYILDEKFTLTAEMFSELAPSSVKAGKEPITVLGKTYMDIFYPRKFTLKAKIDSDELLAPVSGNFKDVATQYVYVDYPAKPKTFFKELLPSGGQNVRSPARSITTQDSISQASFQIGFERAPKKPGFFSRLFNNPSKAHRAKLSKLDKAIIEFSISKNKGRYQGMSFMDNQKLLNEQMSGNQALMTIQKNKNVVQKVQRSKTSRSGLKLSSFKMPTLFKGGVSKGVALFTFGMVRNAPMTEAAQSTRRLPSMTTVLSARNRTAGRSSVSMNIQNIFTGQSNKQNVRQNVFTEQRTRQNTIPESMMQSINKQTNVNDQIKIQRTIKLTKQVSLLKMFGRNPTRQRPIFEFPNIKTPPRTPPPQLPNFKFNNIKTADAFGSSAKKRKGSYAPTIIGMELFKPVKASKGMSDLSFSGMEVRPLALPAEFFSTRKKKRKAKRRR